MLTMLKKDFWYDLPKELIAQEPASPRDAARLMVLSQKDDSIQHKIFHDLPEFLQKSLAAILKLKASFVLKKVKASKNVKTTSQMKLLTW